MHFENAEMIQKHQKYTLFRENSLGNPEYNEAIFWMLREQQMHNKEGENDINIESKWK